MRKLLHAILFSWTLLLGGAAFAQGSAKAPPPGFEPIKGKEEAAKIDPSPLVVGAYATFFLGMFGYLIFVVRKQTAISKEMTELAARIDRVEEK